MWLKNVEEEEIQSWEQSYDDKYEELVPSPKHRLIPRSKGFFDKLILNAS